MQMLHKFCGNKDICANSLPVYHFGLTIVDLDFYLYCIIDLYCVDISGNGAGRMLGFKPDQRI